MAKRHVLTDKLGNEILSSNSSLGFFVSILITTFLAAIGIFAIGGIVCGISKLFS